MKWRPSGGSFRALEARKITAERSALVSCYHVGLDVYKASICIAVLKADGKLVMESVIEMLLTSSFIEQQHEDDGQ
jgi:hypothetical protein